MEETKTVKAVEQPVKAAKFEKVVPPNIFQRLLKISAEIETVSKNLSVNMGKNSYKATGEADVLRAVKPLEAAHGVYSYPVKRTIIESGQLESVDYNGNAKKQLYLRLEVTYRFVSVDNPEDFIEITTYGDGIDSGDKATGKAMTYADKYALLKAYKIVTGDDPDQNGSEDLKGKKNKLDDKLLSEAEELKIDLKNVAVYLKKNVDDLTNADLKACIEQKKQSIGGAK